MVDGAVLDAIHARFVELDADGNGVLDGNDLILEPLGIAPTVSMEDARVRALKDTGRCKLV